MRRALLVGLLVLLSSSLVAVILATVLRQGMENDTDNLLNRIRELEEAGNADVEEHRVRNELLHACIVDLALALSDPGRDRTRPIANPCPAPLVSPATPSR